MIKLQRNLHPHLDPNVFLHLHSNPQNSTDAIEITFNPQARWRGCPLGLLDPAHRQMPAVLKSSSRTVPSS